MASPGDLEVYRQRYETYRHLDRLRWQLLQIALAAGALVLAFSKGAGSAEPGAWRLIVVGVLLIILGAVMQRIRHGIEMNGRVLRRVGEIVGDDSIPPPSSRSSSTSFWVGVAVITAGAACILAAIF